MKPPRHLRPSLVCWIGSAYLAVDEIQPVAATISTNGELLSLVCWNHLPLPSSTAWPRRSVSSEGSTAWVRDLPDGPAVRLDLLPTGKLECSLAELSDVPVRVGARSRYSIDRCRVSHDPWQWLYLSPLTGLGWESRVQLTVTGQKLLNMSWNLGSGAITSHAVAGSTTAVCIRRALKRPWDFHATYDLYIIHPDRTAPVEALRGDQIDISSLRWQIAPRVNNDRTLLRYLPYTLSECRGAMRAGATDVQFTVRNIDAYPVIEISFLLASKGDARFRRIDEPFNELGVESGGLRDLGIFLEEDLQSPLILEVDPQGPECFF